MSALTVNFVPAVTSGNCTLVSTITDQSVGQVPISSGTATFSVPDGRYQLLSDVPGYAVDSRTISLSSAGAPGPGFKVVVNLTPTATDVNVDDGEDDDTDLQDPSSNLQAAAVAGGNITINNKDLAQDIYSLVPYSSKTWEGYFTGAQCRVYLGNIFLDELQSIQYVVQNNQVPYYGYASRFLDGYGQGKSIVQGQIIINYVSEGYLFLTLDNYRRTTLAESGSKDPNSDAAKQIQALMATQLLVDNAKKGSRRDVSLTAMLAKYASNPQAVALAKKTYSPGGFDPVYCNPTYQDIVFDLEIEIGTGEYKTYRKIEKVKLTTNEQVLDQSGNIVAEAYGFLARRLR